MSVAHLTQRLSPMLTISNLLGSRVLMLLLSPCIQSLANFILPQGFPSVSGTYNLARCILTKVSKSWVCMTNNYSRGAGFLALLWFPPFAIKRVGLMR
jgi:hypothetical protein